MPSGRAGAPVVAVAGMGFGAVGLVLAGVRWGRPAGLQEVWFTADAPLGLSRLGLAANELLVVVAQLLLVGCWIGLGLLVRRGLAGVRTVVAGAVAGAAPLLFGTPLFSNDAYTYVAVGQLLDRGRDPYRVGWGALGDPRYAHHVDQVWQHTPSPYSPVLLRALQLDAFLARGNLLVGVVLLRLAAVVAFVALGFVIARAVTSPAVSPVALWLSVANPLLAEHLLSGLHIDLYVALLLVLAVVAHGRGHHLGAVLLVVAAAQVKVTAAVVLPVLLADLVLADPAPGAGGRHRWIRAAGLGVGSVVVFVVVSELTGLGNGWVHALSVPALGRNSLTPVNAVADLLARAGVSGAPPADFHVVHSAAGFRVAGTAVALVAIGWASLRVRRLGAPVAAAAALTAVAGFGAATWPWYLAPAVALVAVGTPRRAVVVAVVGVSAAFALALKPGGAPILLHAPVVADLAVLALLAGVVALLAVDATGAAPG